PGDEEGGPPTIAFDGLPHVSSQYPVPSTQYPVPRTQKEGSPPAPPGGGLEFHLRSLTFLFVRDLEQRLRLEAEVAGHEVRRERLGLRVVHHRGVVVRLPRECDLVLGRRELLL